MASSTSARRRSSRLPGGPPEQRREASLGNGSPVIGAIHRLYACTTCERGAMVGASELTRGARFAAACDRALASRTGARIDLCFLRVPCLNGCPSPCNAGLRAPRKYYLRFSRLDESLAEALVDTAHAYVASETGDPDEFGLPAELLERLTVRAPPPHLLFAGQGT